MIKSLFIIILLLSLSLVVAVDEELYFPSYADNELYSTNYGDDQLNCVTGGVADTPYFSPQQPLTPFIVMGGLVVVCVFADDDESKLD